MKDISVSHAFVHVLPHDGATDRKWKRTFNNRINRADKCNSELQAREKQF